MGCDIHTMVERYNPKTGKWKDMAGTWGWVEYSDGDRYPMELYGGRNYKLFGYLAEVRDEGYDDNSVAKGFPDDCSKRAKGWEEDIDLHSHTYFTLSELLAWKLFFEEDTEIREEVSQFYTQVVPALLGICTGSPDDVRILICFDN